MPERLTLSLKAEGAPDNASERYAKALYGALMKSGGFGPRGIYQGHTPKRIALAQRLAREGYTESASVVWRPDESVEELDAEWGRLTFRELFESLDCEPLKDGERRG
jgi:hypothetical protein